MSGVRTRMPPPAAAATRFRNELVQRVRSILTKTFVCIQVGQCCYDCTDDVGCMLLEESTLNLNTSHAQVWGFFTMVRTLSPQLQLPDPCTMHDF